MARVSHKKIKQLIAQKQSKITDRQFFTSRILAAHFADIAAAQTRRYGCRRRVKLDIKWEPKSPSLARTDNLLIHINAGNPFVTKQKGRQARYEMVSGLFSHELGHVLYTDFLLYQSYHSFLESGKWFPEPPPLRNITERDAEADFLAFQASDPKNRELVALVTHDILNILEDGYIENRMLLDYPGILGSSLEKIRQVQFDDHPSMEDMIEQEADGGHIWQSIHSGLLSYMLWGKLKYGGTPLSDERIQMVFSLLGDLDKALVSRDARDRCRTANLILIRCWSHIKDLLENIKEQADNAASEGGGSGAGDPNDLLSTLLADVERLLNRIAENSVTTELERQRTEELTELAQSISYGDIHDGVSKTVHRIASVSEELKEEYQSIAGDLLHISKQLQKSVLQQMQDSRRGGKQTSLLMGRRLDAHALFRTDSRVFYKNALPNEMPALCVGLLLDESGSMSWDDRATYARATAIILYDFCQALGIPITVYGHSTSRGVDLYSYAEFDAIDRDDRYRMMDISARGSNRDGAALRFVAERLVHRPEDIKLLMLVSDGQPADAGYGGTAAEEDLRGIKHEYQRKGVLFIAAAIGSDKENIERIYGDAFLDITDLTKLPVKLAGIIKRFIRY